MRCKVVCESITNTVQGSQVKFRPVTAGSEENSKFFKYTPGGEINLSIVQHETANKMIPGKEYYVDFTVCE